MLSKIAFFETDEPPRHRRRSRAPPARTAAASAIVRLDDAVVAPVPGGTLGLCFEAEISGAKAVSEDASSWRGRRASLAKETDILLHRLYGKYDRARPSSRCRLRTERAGSASLMPALVPLRRPDAARRMLPAMARECRDRLEGSAPQHDFSRPIWPARRRV